MTENSSTSASAAIDAFIVGQTQLAFLNDFDGALRGREERLPDRTSGGPAAELAWLLYELARNHFYMLRVGNLKLMQIAKGIRWAMDAGNATVQISLVRSLLEHTAALSFQVAKLAGLQEDLSRQGDFERMKGAVKRHQSIVQKLYFNQVSRLGKTSEQKHFHVNDYRKALRKDYPEEERVYDELCEFVQRWMAAGAGCCRRSAAM